MAKILHIADLHLDAPHTARLKAERAALRRSEQLETFSRIMNTAAEKADAVLISGDLFDGENARRETLSVVRRKFEALGDIPIFISPGNHDPYPVYENLKLSENVVVFPPEGGAYDIERLGIRVCGAGFASRYEKPAAAPLDFEKSGELANILVLHGDMSGAPGSERYNPLSGGDFEGFDYAALGHIHSHGGICGTEGGAKWAYPGIPEPGGFDEGFGGGCIIGEIERGKVELRHVKTAKRGYVDIDLDLPQGVSDNEAVIEKAAEKIEKFGEGNIVRVSLIGRTEKWFSPDAALIAERLKPICFHAEVIDRTRKRLDLSAEDGDRSLRAVYIRRMKKTAENHPEGSRERRLADRALRLGLEAMEGGPMI